MKSRERHPAPTRKERLLSCECGASSGEFAFAIMVLAIAIVVGGLGGVWIAKREGMQKPKPTEPSQVTEKPSAQPMKQPEPEKPAEAPAKAPSPKPPEAKLQAPIPEARPVGSRLPSPDAVHYSSRAGTTEVTIELGALSLVKAAGLSNPERVYFDFQPAGQASAARGRLDARNATNIGNDALLAGVRIACWKSGDVRVVFDLRRSCDFSYKVASEPASRLIVELKPR